MLPPFQEEVPGYPIARALGAFVAVLLPPTFLIHALRQFHKPDNSKKCALSLAFFMAGWGMFTISYSLRLFHINVEWLMFVVSAPSILLVFAGTGLAVGGLVDVGRSPRPLGGRGQAIGALIVGSLLSFSAIYKYATGTASFGSSPPPPSVILAPDHSLAMEEYLNRGMPAPDRPWAGEDFLRAAQVLKSLANQDVSSLPRVHSSASGAILKRVSNPENLEGLKGLPPEIRMQSLGGCLEGCRGMLLTYIEATNKGKSFDAEMVETSIAILQVMRPMFETADGIVIAENDPNRAARLRGLQQMKSGFANIVNGSVTTLTERSIYRTQELSRLAKALQSEVVPIFDRLPEFTQSEIKARVSEMARTESDPGMKLSIGALAAALTTPR